MILILSRGVSEISTNKVIDYLISLGALFLDLMEMIFLIKKLRLIFILIKMNPNGNSIFFLMKLLLPQEILMLFGIEEIFLMN